jgi:hypothetical protein
MQRWAARNALRCTLSLVQLVMSRMVDAVPPPVLPPAIVAGVVTLYRFYDVGYAIDLAAAEQCLAAQSARRQLPAQARQAASVEVAQPPLRVSLGPADVHLPGVAPAGRLRASLYDLGAIVIAIDIELAGPVSWEQVADLVATCQDPPEAIEQRFERALAELVRVVQPAIDRPVLASIVEDYTVLIVECLAEGGTVSDLATHPLVRAALLGESRPLSAEAGGLVTSLSYLPDDLALLSWGAALFADSEPLAAETAANLVEFANVELLLLRSYDADLDDELPRVNQRVAAARRRFALPLARRYGRLLSEVEGLVLEIVEVSERVDNALKVTDDVYWNRLYSAMLDVLRVQVWRDGVDHKLALLREAYSMLHDDADAERALALEVTIVILIVVEIALAFLHHG